MADERNKCGHDICICTVGDDDTYCSEMCAAAGETDMTDIKCDCGHGGCDTV